MQMTHEVIVPSSHVHDTVPALTGAERLALILLALTQPVTRIIGSYPWASGGLIVGLLFVMLRLVGVEDDCTPCFCGEVYSGIAFGTVMLWQREENVSRRLSLWRALVVGFATFLPFGIWALVA